MALYVRLGFAKMCPIVNRVGGRSWHMLWEG